MPANLCPLSLGWGPSHLISALFTLVFTGRRIPKDPRPPTKVSKTLARCLRDEEAKLALKFNSLGTSNELFEQVSSAYLFLSTWFRKIGNADIEIRDRLLLKLGKDYANFSPGR